MSLFPKQAANSLVTETLQYFVFLCRSGYSAILSKCLIINDLRFILTILFFTAFLNITHVARHTFATLQLAAGTDIYTISKMLTHSNLSTTQVYADVVNGLKRNASEQISLKD
ncbi:tyrosine-type recombinase/integrase [Bacteroides fragilis]|uniref:tyrosine-type recombinase/integrase n=1 Tax=Bacteroides fragilis TaxID=817 RepID=UPI0011B48A7E|nr:tyrosine-type recombinase/integrase [Bacteroides fragilis]KAB5473895.1 tyrosine-type recombinase/integrase [Bacteroides fragilis]MCE9397275.1 tyrosine-type recombinase/integrase [Bacteroides fragilis]TWV46975.1 tyrosine-type recombinase/integrase [Bacteroides fragilis]